MLRSTRSCEIKEIAKGSCKVKEVTRYRKSRRKESVVKQMEMQSKFVCRNSQEHHLTSLQKVKNMTIRQRLVKQKVTIMVTRKVIFGAFMVKRWSKCGKRIDI